MEKQIVLPKAAVKRIMKRNEDVTTISAEAVVVVAKLTEDFIAQLVRDSFTVCRDNNRKTVKLEDLLSVIENKSQQLEFLDGAFANLGK